MSVKPQGDQSQKVLLKPQRVCVLLNASSGTFAGGDRARLEKAIGSAFLSNGINATLEFVAGGDLEDVAARVLQKVKDNEVDAIAVGGGDGTISSVAGVLSDSNVPIGILPLGTLNHFAKDLKIPLSIDEAVAVIATGFTRQIDIGEANGRTFVNNSSIGIYPYMVLDRERRRRAGMPKWIAMIPAVLRIFRNLPLRRLSISAAGRTAGYRSPCVFVGNNDYNLSGASLGERAGLDGGQLSLYIAKSQSRTALIALVMRSLFKALDTAKDLQSIRLPSFEIKSKRRQLLVAFDGEIEIVRTPLQYKIKPGALRVFAPG